MPASAEILPTHTPALFAVAVKRAAEVLRRGELAAIPTETVYGLAANAFNPAAVARIYAAKGRPGHNPIIVHVASAELARACAASWPEAAQKLATTFWPGPLTLVLPRSAKMPDIVTAGGSTVGIRWPQHPFMQAVIRECGFPLAAPSANLSNQLSPTSAEHVAKQLGELLPLIVDGGHRAVGIESTVVDVSGEVPTVLRPGIISAAQIEEALGRAVATKQTKTEGALRSPGLLAKHDSPKTPLKLLHWRDEADLRRQLKAIGTAPDRVMILAHSQVPLGGSFPHVWFIPEDAEAYARALYELLHRCDEAQPDLIVVETPPDTPEWSGILDRLRRASAVDHH